MPDLPMSCTCGALRGVLRDVQKSGGNRVVCYCDDCQAFAFFLDSGRSLDAHGGTDIFQTSPARLEIVEGAEQLACVRLRPKGLLRWYARCCRTPLGNTPPWPGLPFVGLIVACLAAGDAPARDAALGPVRVRVFARYVRGDRGDLQAHEGGALGTMLRLLPGLLRARLRGDHRRSPFFDAASGTPAALPQVLDDGELGAIEAARDAR